MFSLYHPQAVDLLPFSFFSMSQMFKVFLPYSFEGDRREHTSLYSDSFVCPLLKTSCFCLMYFNLEWAHFDGSSHLFFCSSYILIEYSTSLGKKQYYVRKNFFSWIWPHGSLFFVVVSAMWKFWLTSVSSVLKFKIGILFVAPIFLLKKIIHFWLMLWVFIKFQPFFVFLLYTSSVILQ